MAPFYIKHPQGYCYLKQEHIFLFFLWVVDYFIHTYVITDSDTISQYHKLSAKCDNGMLEYLAFDVSPHKLFTTTGNERYSLNDIQKNYFSILETKQLIDDLLASLEPYQEEIKNITNLDLKPIFGDSYEIKKDYYIQTKECQHQAQLNDIQKNDLLKKWEAEFEQDCFFRSHDIFTIPSYFEQMVPSWSEILNEKGEPFEVEDNTVAEHFGKKKSYAIFFEDGGHTGFWDERRWILDIGGAKLFQSIEEAQKAIVKHSIQGAIVEVNVEFSKIIENTTHVNIKPLEKMLALKEKEQIENNEVLNLAQKLLAQLDNDDCLKGELELFLAEKKTNNSQIKSRRKKI